MEEDNKEEEKPVVKKEVYHLYMLTFIISPSELHSFMAYSLVQIRFSHCFLISHHTIYV